MRLRESAGTTFPVVDMRSYQVGVLYNMMNKLAMRTSGSTEGNRGVQTKLLHAFLASAIIGLELEG